MPNFTDREIYPVDVGVGTITYETGRVDSHLFNDTSYELRDDAIIWWSGSDLVGSVVIDDLNVSASIKDTIKEAISFVKRITNPCHYFYGFSRDFDIDWDGRFFELSCAVTNYWIGYFGGDHTAPYKKFEFSSGQKIIDTQRIEEGMKVLVISSAIVMTLALLVMSGAAVAGEVAAILNGLMAAAV